MAAAITGLALGAGGSAEAQILTPDNVLMSGYGNSSINNGTDVEANRANAFDILTNGIIDRGDLDRVNTFNLDDTGVTLDFLGLEYATPSQFDFIQIELGRQFGDGGDWEAMPNVYVLKNPLLVGHTVEPNMSPNWVQLPSASIVEATGHAFTPINVAGPGGTIRFDLTGIPAADRTGWAWAVGGVDGNQDADGDFNFTNFTEAFAEGLANQAVPAVPAPATLTPANVISNAYHTVGRSGDAIFDVRGQAFASVRNGQLDSVVGLANDGFDTYEADAGGTLTDFVGLQYSTLGRFDSITIDLGNQFGDGGDWDSTPRIFILKNPVDTNLARPEDDPTNWGEVIGATETTGHAFSPLVTPGAGGTINFDLSSIPAEERMGWGWAVGGVDGNANADGVVNFISITELDATGIVVPGPYDLSLEANSNGEVRIVNDTQFDLEMDFYEISSDGEALNLAGWNSLGDGVANPGTHDPSEFPVGTGLGDGWEENANLDSSIVNESYLQGSSVLEAGEFISLGNLYSGPEQDLQFMYRLAGGAFINGLVDYIGTPGLNGDFNNDGFVNAADYVLWRDQMSDDAGAYATWRSNFGGSLGSGSQTAVPEPGSLALLGMLAMSGLLLRWRQVRMWLTDWNSCNR